MNNLLFLDIDGVVNTVMIKDEDTKTDSCIKKDGYYFDLCHPEDNRVSNREAVLWVSKLCEDYKLDIVITSTWLLGSNYGDIAFALYSSGLSKNIKVIDGVSNNLQHSRGWQIEAWFNKNSINPKNINFIILDDDTDMLGFHTDFTDHLVKTDTYIGFSYRDYIKASELLDQQIGD